MNKLLYAHYNIVFQEVPNETTLVFNISGCPHKCEGCHSKYLWDYVGHNLSEDIYKILDKYNGLITCVCFMGGDQNLYELNQLLYMIKRDYKLKTCVYSGSDNIHIFDNSLQFLDYLKIGRYDGEYGGLNEHTTNQKFYKVIDCKCEDTTNIFWNKQ